MNTASGIEMGLKIAIGGLDRTVLSHAIGSGIEFRNFAAQATEMPPQYWHKIWRERR